MLSFTIDPLECFRPSPTAYMLPCGMTFVVDPVKEEVRNYGPLLLEGTITESDADGIDAAVIASQRGEPSQPLDDALRDLGL